MAFRKYELYCKPSKVGEGKYEDVHISTPQEVYEVCKTLRLGSLTREKVYAFCLDTKKNLIGVVEVSSGGLDSSIVDLKVVFGAALAIGRTAGIILAHNHPSGDATPSDDDRRLTNRVKEAGEILSIRLLDHIIVGNDCYYSFCEDGEI